VAAVYARCMFALLSFLHALDVTFSLCRCFLSADGGLITGERIDGGGATSLAGNAVVAMAAALLCIAFPAVQAML